jgi:hypothetical protein
MRLLMFRLLLAAAVSTAPGRVEAETTARQRYLVSIPPRVSIQAPPAGANAELPPDETQVQVPQQVWDISANTQTGATVEFATEQSFHNLDDDSIRRDAQLNVSIVSQSQTGAWTVTQSQAVTAHQIGEESAAVQVRSTQAGSAVIGLTVTFLQGDALSTPGGDYVTTVVGTITAN